jgi:hypothetical protein
MFFMLNRSLPMGRKLLLTAGLLAGLAGLGFTSPASAGAYARADVAVRTSWVHRRHRCYVRPRPVVVRPAPCVVAPAACVVAPAPAVCVPAPVCVRPAPVICP